MYFLTEIRVSDFESGAVSAQGRFKVVSPCTDAKSRDSAKVFKAVKSLQGDDQRQALLGLKKLLKLAQLGKPFNQLSDAKTVHEAFNPFYCDVTKKNETVWRYRHGDIRILFYYATDKVVLLTHTLPKRTDKLSNKDINQAKQAVVDFLTASRTAAGLQWIE
ncbi:type II toxin-antitoxin system RelE/ParE family toxin [Curvibacter sp. CHRR-16]|uniref:type II toxin-antitoxin system RelE/ParE family toxin n=1 Tax=Curvibacter sp. CHRR-16 TaxID=2835872 RepID=UPI001BDACA34|nr:type II toxin-antitoxin system RelE/ParE family toxin [Curvibacter sp. CHRR-16]MBT0569816.1 type II toxin-antitoxin system RelE/ParE family toxin [Curvibacter sp. CHRR-16]